LLVRSSFLQCIARAPEIAVRKAKKKKKTAAAAAFPLRPCHGLLLFGMASPSVPSGGVQIARCPVLFNGTNYHDWVPRLRWHMRGLRLWEFLTGDMPCPPPPVAPVRPTIPDKAADNMKMKLLDEYDASMDSCAS
jgi:hypothetical protein